MFVRAPLLRSHLEDLVPNVEVSITTSCPLPKVWSAVVDITAYPTYMANVNRVAIVRDEGHSRTSQWEVLLKGSILEWTERETIDHEKHRVEFEQIDGDLSIFRGAWQVTLEGDQSVVTLDVEFEIGIPLLADMLNPIAAKALEVNSETMIRELEARVAAAQSSH
jgi:ribosome-associated toxin RatA of RatAB toxin-antitoxin module